MRKLLFGLLCVVSCAFAQTTVRLRDGDFTSTYRIAAGSFGHAGASPILKLKNSAGQFSHSLQNGDLVFIQNVRGCFDLNGFRKVINANPDSGSLQLADESGNTILCSAPWVDNFEAGRLGKVSSYNLFSHPRMYITPALDSRVNGSSAPAPIVTENSPAYQGLIARYATPSSSQYALDDPAVCDGKTFGSCPHAEALLKSSSGDVFFGYGLGNLALLWYSNQTAPKAPQYLNAIKYVLNHIERVLQYQTNNGPSTAGLPFLTLYGRGSEADWVSLLMQGASTAYSIVRSQMSQDERTAFANKMLNGVEQDTTCSLTQPSDTGQTVSSSGTLLISTGGFSSMNVGDWVLAISSQSYGSAAYSWYQLAAIADDTHATATTASTNRSAAEMFYVPGDPLSYQAWDGNQCGLSAVANMHVYSPYYASPSQPATLAQAIPGAGSPGDVITINLNADGAGITLATPFYLYSANGEWFQVTARNGNSLTAVRGQLSSGIHGSSLQAVVIARRWATTTSTLDPFLLTNDWQHNLTLNKQLGFLATGLSLADDDPRAAALLQQAVNFYHDYTYFDLASSATIRMQGGNTLGYQMGRWGNMTAQIAGLLQSGMGLDLSGGYLQRYVYYPLYLSWPGDPVHGPGEDWSNGNAAPSQLNWLWMLPPGTNEAKYGRYWFDTKAGANTSRYWQVPGMPALFYRLLYGTSTDPSSDYTKLNPWIVATTIDNSGRPYPYGIVVSRNSWTSGSYLLVNAQNLASDHDYGDGTFKEASDYIVAYNSTSLIAGDTGVGTIGSDTGNNFFEIGGSYTNRRIGAINWNEVSPSSEGGDRTTIDQSTGTSTYVYARLNYLNAWKSSQHLTRAYRYYDHLKTGTGKDYVLVFDDVASATPNQKRTRIHYHKFGDPSATLTGGGTASMVFKKPTQGAMISTQLLFPDGNFPTLTDAANANTNTEIMDWGSTNSAQMIAVHRISPNVSDTMPPIAYAATDATSIGVEINDSDTSWAIVYPKDGTSQTARRITCSYSGIRRILIHGLSPGYYHVSQDEADYLKYQSVGPGGTLLFTAPPGSHTFQVVPASSLPPTVSGSATIQGSIRIQ